MSKVFISRQDGTVSWGFRLQGGLEYNEPLTVTNVSEICFSTDVYSLISEEKHRTKMEFFFFLSRRMSIRGNKMLLINRLFPIRRLMVNLIQEICCWKLLVIMSLR